MKTRINPEDFCNIWTFVWLLLQLLQEPDQAFPEDQDLLDKLKIAQSAYMDKVLYDMDNKKREEGKEGYNNN